MQKLLMTSVAVLGLATGTAFAQSDAPATPGTAAAPPTSHYRGGAGSPYSTRATDLKPGHVIGSRLPAPDASSDDPRALLTAAQRDLDRHQTGAAQHALEMAETRILTRTTPPDMAAQPDPASMVHNISQARQALGSRDINGAKQAIAAALQDQVPPPGPAVTTIPGTAPMSAPMGTGGTTVQ